MENTYIEQVSGYQLQDVENSIEYTWDDKTKELTQVRFFYKKFYKTITPNDELFEKYKEKFESKFKPEEPVIKQVSGGVSLVSEN